MSMRPGRYSIKSAKYDTQVLDYYGKHAIGNKEWEILRQYWFVALSKSEGAYTIQNAATHGYLGFDGDGVIISDTAFSWRIIVKQPGCFMIEPEEEDKAVQVMGGENHDPVLLAQSDISKNIQQWYFQRRDSNP